MSARLLASRAGLALALLLAAAACMTSPKPEVFPAARQPYGAAGTVRVGSGPRVNVELLAVTDSGYLLLARDRVATLRFRGASRADFAGVGTVTYYRGGFPSRTVREQLRLASRFPQGIPDPAMAALLAAAGQQAPDDLEAPRTP